MKAVLKNSRMLVALIAMLLGGYRGNATPADTMKLIRVQILHGSKPLAITEKKTIGGLWGGHVVVQMDTTVYGFSFSSKKIHAVVHHHKNAGIYQVETLTEWNNAHATGMITIIEIPLTPTQYNTLQREYETYAKESPHDYAFFGMRCAASCYWLLSSIGIESECNRPKSIRRAFYPKALRLKLEKLAREKNYNVIVQQGRKTRKWEGG